MPWPFQPLKTFVIIVCYFFPKTGSLLGFFLVCHQLHSQFLISHWSISLAISFDSWGSFVLEILVDFSSWPHQPLVFFLLCALISCSCVLISAIKTESRNSKPLTEIKQELLACGISLFLHHNLCWSQVSCVVSRSW